ncbi:MAG: hypothetical protein ABI949_04470 [Ilumatobacteraceae bacterium]
MTLAARGEFSIVIASLGVTLHDGTDLGAVAAGFVLLTALISPIAARFADRLAKHLPASVSTIESTATTS